MEYISEDFQILVHTAGEYPQEVKLLAKENYQMTLHFDQVSKENAASWIDDNLEFLEKLDLKIPKIESDSSKAEQRKSFIVQKYLEYQNLLESLRQDWGDVYESVYKCINNRQEFLEGRFMISTEAQPPSVIKEELRLLREDIMNEVKTLKGSDLEKIIWGVISDWLIRCPLDF